MKKTFNLKIIPVVIFAFCCLAAAPAFAADNSDIHKLKETQRLDKSNPAGKNIFRTFKKSVIEENLIKRLETPKKIESFINDVAANSLSLFNVPKLFRNLSTRIKQSVISGEIAPASGDELLWKLKSLWRSVSTRNAIEACGDCGEECDLSKFLAANIGNSYETGAISANDATNLNFRKSQDAIAQGDYAGMVQAFDACLPEIDRLMAEMPDIKSCKPKNCEQCYSIYYALFTEYLFLKKYMAIQKGYFLLKAGKYAEAEAYFRKIQQPAGPAIAARINMSAEKKAIMKWHEDAMKVTLLHFIGRCLYEQGKYSESISYFVNSRITNMPAPPELSTGYDYDTAAMFNVYPYSGLYSDFSPYGEDVEKRKPALKSFFFVWQSNYFSGMAYYMIGSKKEALIFFNNYLKGNDKEYEEEAKKKIAELEAESPAPAPVEVSEIKFLRADGTEVKWGDILEVNQNYIIQAITRKPSSELAIKINYSSNYAKGSWNLQKNQNDGIYQAMVKIDSSIIGLNPDNKWRFVAFDYLPDEKSNLGDSKLFIEKASTQLGYINGGYFQASNTGIPNEVKEDGLNPVLPITKEAFMTAGVEYLNLGIANVKKIIPFKNQANVFYYSGHGSSRDGSLAANISFNPNEIMNNEWDSLRVVIIAGCSVLSLDNQLQISGGHKTNPGLQWVNLGRKSKLKNFLGYRFTAPRDNQQTGNSTILASKIICNNFFEVLKNQPTGSLIDWCSAWMEANDNKNGRNACAIELKIGEKNKYHYFLKRDEIFSWGYSKLKKDF